jgi:flagellar biosynthesis chaperone FliJ
LSGEEPKNRLGKQEFFLRYSVASNKQIKKLKDKVSELESQQREKIAELLKVRRFKEGLERLQAEAKIQFIKEQEKIEQKELDEGATVSFVRKKSSILSRTN